MIKRLNLGCGNRLLQYYADEWFLTSAFLQHEKRQIPDGPEADVLWDLNDLPWPWPDNRFNRIEAWAVFEHLKLDLVEALDECWRILTPNGKLHVKVPYWKSYRAHKAPDHRWHGWEPGVFDYFDPRTKYGRGYDAVSARKWRIESKGWTDKDHHAFYATMYKRLDEEQWSMTLDVEPPGGFVVWVNGRSQAGKSTVTRGLARLFPHAVIVDDEHLWSEVWGRTYRKAQGARPEDVFTDEEPADPHASFAYECARVACVLAKQGHMVLVDMIASPVERRAKIKRICRDLGSPLFWVYVKREEGETKLPLFDRMTDADWTTDHAVLTKKQSIESVAQFIEKVRRGK